MISQNSTHAYGQLRVRQQLRKRQILEVPGGKMLWQAIGKTVVFIIPLILVVNFWMGSSAHQVSQSITALEHETSVLQNENISLKVKTVSIFSQTSIEEIAAKRLSLYKPGRRQLPSF